MKRLTKAMQLWHVGENKDGEEVVLQASPFGKELQEFRLQPDESIMVRTGNHSDLLVVACRLSVPTENIVSTLERMLKLVGDLMPGVANISLPDYALLNEAPIEARSLISKLKEIVE